MLAQPGMKEERVKAMSGLLRPQDLHQISSDAEMEKMDEERQLKERKQRQELELREAFMSREIQPEAIERRKRSRQARISSDTGGDLPLQLLQRWREKNQYRRSGMAEHPRRLCEEGLRVLRKRTAPSWVQAPRRDHQLSWRHARRSRTLLEMVSKGDSAVHPS
jgi:hypothetical protein